MPAPTVAIYFVKASLERVGQQVPVDSLLEKNHIPRYLLERDNARVPGEDFANLVRDMMLLTGDEQLGHGNAAQPLGSWATMAQLCIGADNLGDALRRLARFYRLVPWGIDTRLEVEDDEASFVMKGGSESHFAPYLFETFLFYVYRFSNWLINKQMPLIGVEFCFPDPPQRAEYRRLFLSSNFSFDKSASRFRFAAHYLNEPIRQNSQTLKKFLEHTNLAMVAQTYLHKSWRNRVQQHLTASLTANPAIQTVARELGIHPHTLRRQLQKEGVQFKELKDEVRCELAIELLRNPLCSIENIALQLGYSETSAFSRAFKKWMGLSPLQYKKFKGTDRP